MLVARLFAVFVLCAAPAWAGRGQPATTPSEVTSLQTSSNGLQHADLAIGYGDPVRPGDVIVVDYTGWLPDGTRFDSSLTRAAPFTFKVGQGAVIQGWDQGVIGMRTGGRRQLKIPASLGYGAVQRGPIPANSELTFEIELRSIATPPTRQHNPPYLAQGDGLMVHDIQLGDGMIALKGSTVDVHYSGWLDDGTAIDSSLTRGKPFTFTLGEGRVIAGWERGIEGMAVGGKRQLRIPAALAYGDRNAGPIPPGSTLTFSIELLDVR